MQRPGLGRSTSASASARSPPPTTEAANNSIAAATQRSPSPTAGMAWTRRPLRRIFEPYFTTKGTLGHGLKLSTSIEIVARSHGMLDVKSKPGIGTTFELLLPIVANDNETLNPQMGRIISSIAA
jgi:hypothetical protein